MLFLYIGFCAHDSPVDASYKVALAHVARQQIVDDDGDPSYFDDDDDYSDDSDYGYGVDEFFSEEAFRAAFGGGLSDDLVEMFLRSFGQASMFSDDEWSDEYDYDDEDEDDDDDDDEEDDDDDDEEDEDEDDGWVTEEDDELPNKKKSRKSADNDGWETVSSEDEDDEDDDEEADEDDEEKEEEKDKKTAAEEQSKFMCSPEKTAEPASRNDDALETRLRDALRKVKLSDDGFVEPAQPDLPLDSSDAELESEQEPETEGGEEKPREAAAKWTESCAAGEAGPQDPKLEERLQAALKKVVFNNVK